MRPNAQKKSKFFLKYYCSFTKHLVIQELWWMWTRNVACHFSKQRCGHNATSHYSHPLQYTLGEFRTEENKILSLHSSDGYQSNNFNKLKYLHLPIQRKALKSLTWDVFFFLISSNFSCSATQLFFPPSKTPIYPCSFLTSLEHSLWASERLYPGYSFQ